MVFYPSLLAPPGWPYTLKLDLFGEMTHVKVCVRLRQSTCVDCVFGFERPLCPVCFRNAAVFNQDMSLSEDPSEL